MVGRSREPPRSELAHWGPLRPAARRARLAGSLWRAAANKTTNPRKPFMRPAARTSQRPHSITRAAHTQLICVKGDDRLECGQSLRVVAPIRLLSADCNIRRRYSWALVKPSRVLGPAGPKAGGGAAVPLCTFAVCARVCVRWQFNYEPAARPVSCRRRRNRASVRVCVCVCGPTGRSQAQLLRNRQRVNSILHFTLTRPLHLFLSRALLSYELAFCSEREKASRGRRRRRAE